MGIADAVLETGGCERFGGGAFSLVERRLRAEIGWYVSVGSSAGVLIWDKDSDGRLSARNCLSPSDPDSGHSGRKVCSSMLRHMDQITHYAIGCCVSCSVIFPFECFLLLNSYLQNKLSGILMLCDGTVALKKVMPHKNYDPTN